jgi:hypothetical protein
MEEAFWFVLGTAVGVGATAMLRLTRRLVLGITTAAYRAGDTVVGATGALFAEARAKARPAQAAPPA